MTNPKVSHIKRAQKEKLLMRTISQLFYEACADDVRLNGLSITKVVLSPDKGNCHVYFYSTEGKEAFKDQLEILKLYKPSMRAALAREIDSRYTPELMFKFDTHFEELQRIEKVLDDVSKNLKKEDA